MESQEEKISNTPWQIRCPPEQKQFFQQFVAQSGLTAQEAIARSFESFRIQISEDAESKQALLEFDSLIMRLQSMMRAQLVVALEKQKQCEEEKKGLDQEKDKYHELYSEMSIRIENEFEVKKNELYAENLKNINLLKADFEEKIKTVEKNILDLRLKNENLESSLQKSEREKIIIQKQYQDSLRAYEIADDRLMELKEKNKSLQEKLANYELLREKNLSLEKEVAVLHVKLDATIREESIKREYMEKEIRRELKSTPQIEL